MTGFIEILAGLAFGAVCFVAGWLIGGGRARAKAEAGVLATKLATKL